MFPWTYRPNSSFNSFNMYFVHIVGHLVCIGCLRKTIFYQMHPFTKYRKGNGTNPYWKLAHLLRSLMTINDSKMDSMYEKICGKKVKWQQSSINVEIVISVPFRYFRFIVQPVQLGKLLWTWGWPRIPGGNTSRVVRPPGGQYCLLPLADNITAPARGAPQVARIIVASQNPKNQHVCIRKL